MAALSALDHFKTEIYLEVMLEEGSLKVWLTVLGSLAAGISAYGSLRSGIEYMVSDAKAFSEYIIERVKQEIDLPRGSFYRAERRLGLPGRIQRLYPLLEETAKLIERGNDTSARNRLDHVQDEIQHITSELDEPEDRGILQKLEESIPPPLRKRLPEPVRPSPVPMHVARVLAVTNEERVGRGGGGKPKDLLRRHPRPPKPPRFR